MRIGDLVQHEGRYWLISMIWPDQWSIQSLNNAPGYSSWTTVAPIHSSRVIAFEDAIMSSDDDIRAAVTSAYEAMTKTVQDYRRSSQTEENEHERFKKECRRLITDLAPEKAALIGEIWQSLSEPS